MTTTTLSLAQDRSPLTPANERKSNAFPLGRSLAAVSLVAGALALLGCGSSPGSAGASSDPVTCTTVCDHVMAVCGSLVPAGLCATECPALTTAQQSCAAAATSCNALNACTSTTTGNKDGGSQPSDSGTRPSDSGSQPSDTGSTVGTCPSKLQSGQSCPSPCFETGIDTGEMCVQSCASDADCTAGDYSYCDTFQGGICVPRCSSDGDCTSLGFNGCSGGSHCI